MALQTKCSEFTGKKVVSQYEIFFGKVGWRKKILAIDLPFIYHGNYHWIIYTMFMSLHWQIFINSTFPMIIPTWRTTCFPVECSQHTWSPLKIQCYKAILNMEIVNRKKAFQQSKEWHKAISWFGSQCRPSEKYISI